MSFTGSAPEILNGRLAMLGTLTFVNEMSSHYLRNSNIQ